MYMRIAAALSVVALTWTMSLPAGSQEAWPGEQPDERGTVVAQRSQSNQKPISAASVGESQLIERANSWTIGLAAGLPEGTFLPFAAEIARNLNDGNDLRVLPIVTPGATDNVRDLLYLRGVDIGITHTDVFEHFRTVENINNIERRINFITGLYVSEIHLVVRCM